MLVEIAILKALRMMRYEDVRKATVYLSDKETIVIARPHKADKRSKSATFVLTVGRPNYESREFIKACKKAGEKFPVRKVQLKYWPKPKKGKK